MVSSEFVAHADHDAIVISLGDGLVCPRLRFLRAVPHRRYVQIKVADMIRKLDVRISHQDYESDLAGILVCSSPEPALTVRETLQSNNPVDWRFLAGDSPGRVSVRQVQGG